ncbi:MAG: SPOR domain-containing protein [Neisseria sp.]|nr:SPOR domain-containing protein [Neisseria sp.]
MKKAQQGKGIGSFILGLLIATGIIGSTIYMLNKSRESDFKEPEVRVEQTASQTEVMTPSAPSSGEVPASDAENMGLSGSEVLTDEQLQPSDNTETQASETQVEPQEEPRANVVAPVKKPVPTENKVKKPVEKTEQKSATVKKDNRTQTAEEQPAKKDIKPSAEQILESGNIEKARQKAAAEAEREAKERAERRKAEAALNGQAGKSERKESASQNTSSGKKVVIQAGSFGNEADAESRRAKLAMLGVNTRVASAQVNGKTVYRVQTGVLNEQAASKTRQTLQQNGIENFARSVK